MPGYRSQDRIVRLSRIADGNFVSLEDYICLSLDKKAVDLGGVTTFKSSKLLCKHGVEGIGDHGHDHIKVHLDQNGRRKGIEVEKLDRLGDHVFDPPPSGVIADQQFQWGIEVVGNQKSGFLAAVSPKDQLTQIALIFFQRDQRFMDQRIGILSFGALNSN